MLTMQHGIEHVIDEKELCELLGIFRLFFFLVFAFGENNSIVQLKKKSGINKQTNVQIFVLITQ